VFFDASSGGGTVTINLNAAASSLNSTGWTGTLAIGSFDLAVGGDITHAAGVISIGPSSNAGLTATGTLTLSGSAVLDGSGAASLVTVSGDASITSTSAYFRMGTGTWTFGGSWSNGSTSTNWVAGTGLVIFDSSSSQTLTFANLAGDEFHNVTFQSVAGSGTITFSMAANGLRWGGLLVIQDSAGSTTTLVTSNLALTGGSLTVGNSGVLIANASSVAVVDVTMAGGASGTLTLTSGSWTVSGQWDTSGAGSTFARGTSTVTLSGTSASVTTLDATNGFSNLVISGTITQNTAIDVRGTLSVSGALVLDHSKELLVAIPADDPLPNKLLGPTRERPAPADREQQSDAAGRLPHLDVWVGLERRKCEHFFGVVLHRVWLRNLHRLREL